uniref:TOMATO BUSHY STUNT VIRUS n=1 Tax=Tomato bushy stunt virus TaxID=12145 RepID=UPI0000112D84|nr:Chain A, Tomato Bushy Stunt Virus [Tomato bushy stunt virus]2TBV_B Chain B, Tomato Bushy Stunt Virus [Tomato bushy stunt virus]2TBV_C Chain C, Tomato Bushy Stunt Virus [Tomato bushy stunt virus]
AMTTRNNNNVLAVSKKQLGVLAASAAVGALRNYIGESSPALLQSAVGLGKKALNKVRNRRKQGNQQIITHVGGVGGSIMAPVAVSRQLVGSKPKFTGRTSGGVTVTSHREYLTQVNNSSGFVVNGGIVGNSLQLNPSNGTLFSWLPALASNFDQYSFNSVVLDYVPLCGTTEVGRVALYFDKDSQDPEPADRVELANFGVLKETAPWAEAMLRIPTDKVKRYCNDSATVDQKLIDLGQLGIATYGGAGADAVGELFLARSVTLYFPQPTNTLLSSKRLDLTGSLADATGPGYLVLTRTPTVLTHTFRATGTFNLSGGLRCLTSLTLGATGAVVINDILAIDNVGTASDYFLNCTVSSLPATVTFTVSGVAAGILLVGRARANVVNLL